MIFTEIVDAISTTGCAKATRDAGTGTLTCNTFQVEIMEWHDNPPSQSDLVKSGINATVWHKFTTEDMTVGEYLVIGRLADGRWVTIVWPCDA